MSRDIIPVRQILDQIRHRRRAVFLFDRDHPVEDGVDLNGDVGPTGADGRSRGFAVFQQATHQGFGLEHRVAGQQEIESRSQAVDVGRVIRLA